MPTACFGGPATCGNMKVTDRASIFLDHFLNHIKNGKNYVTGEVGTRIDFTTFHTKGGGYRFDTLAEKQIPSVKELLVNVDTQCSIIKKYGYDNLECVLSEADPDGWAAGGRYDNFNLNFRNTEYYASYVMSSYKNLYDLAEKLHMDIRPLAWAFMFEAERCFEGTRTFTTQGIDKAVFNLFKLFAKMGTQKVELTTTRDLDPLAFSDMNGYEAGPEVDGWATMDGPDEMQVLLYCHHDDWDVNETYDIDLVIDHLPIEGKVNIEHFRIDATHSNAYAEWERQGKPNYPTAGQREAIIARSGLEYCEAPASELVHEGHLVRSFQLPTHGISLLKIRRA